MNEKFFRLNLSRKTIHIASLSQTTYILYFDVLNAIDLASRLQYGVRTDMP